MKDAGLSILIAAALIFAVIQGFRLWVDSPRVFISYQTKECVRVDDPAAKRKGRKPYTCANLPERFDAVWVR